MSNDDTLSNNKNIERLVNEALAIEADSARDAGSLGFMARAMTLATLPHRAVEGSVYQRRNGAFTLTIMSAPDIGLPFGSLPRLLISWLTTEAVKTQSRELTLGSSMSEFMGELGLVASGGQWGSITRLKNQTTRLFSSSINARFSDQNGVAILNQSIAEKAMLWWHPKSAEQAGLWQSSVVLSEQFYKEIIEHPIPIDLRALKALKQSPLCLDIYIWLTYRVAFLQKDVLISWEALAAQFGSDYARLRDFKEAFSKALNKVYVVYGAARFQVKDSGLLVSPAKTHIARIEGK
jgi:hypothetical protein